MRNRTLLASTPPTPRPVLSRFVIATHADAADCAICGALGYGAQVLVTRTVGRSHALVCDACLAALDGRQRKP